MVDFLMAVWNGWSAIFVLLVHAFGGWQEYPYFDFVREAKIGNWYDFGYILGIALNCGLFSRGGSKASSRTFGR